ncbi:cell cycle checkpoint protein rad17 [Anaeramoeba ignava]|uniref:Cell cycle checkpoint protein rad17 n=1 Tax=Anaeramoeba ignava TaxID=1746090 RepID=A0A9Q0L9C6_ANAIG|nr:cell cycle checkpoint protein rad17 [Anaeramoeba ignava]
MSSKVKENDKIKGKKKKKHSNKKHKKHHKKEKKNSKQKEKNQKNNKKQEKNKRISLKDLEKQINENESISNPTKKQIKFEPLKLSQNQKKRKKKEETKETKETKEKIEENLQKKPQTLIHQNIFSQFHPRKNSKLKQLKITQNFNSQLGSSQNSSNSFNIHQIVRNKNNTQKEYHPKTKLKHNLNFLQRLIPKTESDLCINPKKIQEIKNWMVQALKEIKIRNGGRLLILTGSSGIGKTIVIEVLAKSLKCEVCEWKESTEISKKDIDGNNIIPYESRLEDLEQFLYESEKFPSLVIEKIKNISLNSKNENENENEKEKDKDKNNEIPKQEFLSKIIMLEELPFFNSFEQKQRFQNMISRYLLEGVFPLVLIISDHFISRDTRSNSQNLKYGAWSILSKEIINSPLVKHIRMNPIARSYILKVLKKINLNENLKISHNVLSMISQHANGDIRQALILLQLLCLDMEAKKIKNIKPKNEEFDLDFFKKFGRGFSLGIFHSIGKIIFGKRNETNSQEVNKRPSLKFDIEEVIAQSGVDSSTFSLFLHENYLDYSENIEDVSFASEFFSNFDVLITQNWRDDYQTHLKYSELTSRAVIESNYHSMKQFHENSKSKFIRYGFHSPQIFQQNRKLKQNLEETKLLFQMKTSRFSFETPRVSTNLGNLTFRTLTVEMFPYLIKNLSKSTKLSINQQIFLSNFSTYKLNPKFIERQKITERNYMEMNDFDFQEQFEEQLNSKANGQENDFQNEENDLNEYLKIDDIVN